MIAPLTPFSRLGALLGPRGGLWALGLVVALPLAILHAALLIGGEPTELTWAALYLAGTCAWLGPVLNVLWERSLVELCTTLDARARAEGWSAAPLTDVISRYRRAFLWIPLTSGVGLAALVVVLHPFGPPGLFASPFVLASTAFLLGMVSISGGTGATGLVMSVHLTAATIRAGLRWDPFHGDGLGGVQVLSRYSLRTAMMFGVGALAVPHAVQWAEALPPEARVLPFACVLAYTTLLFASFLVPTFLIGTFARREKIAALSAIGAPLSAAVAALHTTDGEAEELLYERCQALLEARREVNSIVAYPFGPWQLLRLLISATAPLSLFAGEHLLSTML